MAVKAALSCGVIGVASSAMGNSSGLRPHRAGPPARGQRAPFDRQPPGALTSPRPGKAASGEAKMSLELQLLVVAVALTLIQVVVAVLGSITQVGMPPLMGNRQGLPEFTGWVGRAHRAHRNMLESLVLFAILVLVAHVANREDATTVLGAELFVGGRVAFAIIYIAGIPYLRTAAWTVALVGMLMIFKQVII
jgi:uncharacterized MAPEG superfamily protein